jgi:F-type H+-transporting ATPase subunit b
MDGLYFPIDPRTAGRLGLGCAVKAVGVGRNMMKLRIERDQIVFLLMVAAYLVLPEAALAAEGGSKWGAWLAIGKVFNLGLVIFVLVWITRKPLKEFFASRTLSIQEQLLQAQRAREEAETKLAEIEARMKHLDDELQQIKAGAEQEARQEYDRLIAEAERDAEKIIDRARQEIDGLMRAAHMELKAHVAKFSVQLAEQKIRAEITEEDQSRLFGNFVNQLGNKP